MTEINWQRFFEAMSTRLGELNCTPENADFSPSGIQFNLAETFAGEADCDHYYRIEVQLGWPIRMIWIERWDRTLGRREGAVLCEANPLAAAAILVHGF